MAEAALAIDLSLFAYLSLPRGRSLRPQLVSTYPEAWTEYYLRNRYERIDPVIHQALNVMEPFTWGLGTERTVLSKPQQELLEEAARFGIRCGFTVPIHDGRGPLAAFTFVSDERRREGFIECIEKNRRVLQLMAMYFHAHARRKLDVQRAIVGVTLSARELECLEWASQGKTAWETGLILGISRNTVAYYLENAKEKLGVRTVVQATTLLAAANK
jgi:DNA-binding CsgD family transcriptional regulator